MTTFAKGSNLVLTFDWSVFLGFLWPLLPVASRGRVLLKFDLNSRPHLVEWRRVLRFLVLLLDDWLCLCQNLCKLYCLYDGYDYLRLHRAVGFLSLSGFAVQMVDCFMKLQRMSYWYCTGCYCYFFLLGLVDFTLLTSFRFVFLVFVHHTSIGNICVFSFF